MSRKPLLMSCGLPQPTPPSPGRCWRLCAASRRRPSSPPSR